MGTSEEKKVTMRGNPVVLLGQNPQVGTRAPEVALVDTDFKTVYLSSYKGKLTVLLSVPSIDTDVCSREVRRFNEEIGKNKETLQCITVSMDLPFAQKRWCGNEGIQNVVTLSDHREAGFGKAYGVLIKDMRLLARSVTLVDSRGVVKFFHIVPEVTNEPDYNMVLEEIKKCLANVT